MPDCQNSKPNQRTVHAIPLTHIGADQPRTRFQIVTWQTNLDIPTTQEQQRNLRLNEQTAIVIQTESLKPDQPKGKPESWNWTLLRIASPTELEDKASRNEDQPAANGQQNSAQDNGRTPPQHGPNRPPQDNRNQQPQNRQPRFTKDQSIARQVAAKLGGEILINHPDQIKPGQTMTQAILDAAEQIYQWIDNPVPATVPEEEPDNGPQLSQLKPPPMPAANPN